MRSKLMREIAMVRKNTVGIFIVFLAVMFTSAVLAQNSKKEVKKETKTTVVNDARKELKQPGTPVAAKKARKDVQKRAKPATMKYVSCSQTGCGFWAKSHSAKELRYIMKRHAKKYHKVELTDQQLKEMVKKEGAK